MDERRIAWLLVVALVAQLLVVAAQLPSAGEEHNRLEAGAIWAIGPAARLVRGTVGGLGAIAEDLRSRRHLEEENQRLEEDNRRLQLRLLRLRDLENQLGPLSAAVHYSPPEGFELQVADVLYIDHASWVRTLVLYAPVAELKGKGSQAVVTSQGLVGRVVLVSGPYAKVQLITDRAASVGAMIQRTRRQGLVQGTSREGLQLSFLPRGSDVRLGDRVVTSGIDGIYPRGLAIGTVTSLEAGSDLFQKIRLASAVDFGTLDHAYILKSIRLPEEALEPFPGQP